MATMSTSEDLQRASPSFLSLQDADEFFDSIPYQPNTSKRRQKDSGLEQEGNLSGQVNRIRNIFEESSLNHDCSFSSPKPTSQRTDRYGSPLANLYDNAIHLSVHEADSDYLDKHTQLSGQPRLPFPRSSKSHPTQQLSALTATSPIKSTRIHPVSNQSTPSRIPRPIRNLNIVDLNAGFTYGQDSDEEDIHSTHGVPLIIPIRGGDLNVKQKASTVSQWLSSLEMPNINQNYTYTKGKIKGKDKPLPFHIKKKENCPPTSNLGTNSVARNHFSHGLFESSSTSIASPSQKNSQLSNKSGNTFSQYGRASDGTTSRNTPHTGLLSMPPRRIGQTPNTSMLLGKANTANHVKSLCQKPKSQLVEDARRHSCPLQELQQDEDVVELSPSVNKNRRRRGIRRHDSSNIESLPRNTDIADFIRNLEANEEEEEPRGRSMHRA